ncbi:MAG TPA: glycosyltransferase family 39 protein [Chthoniobacterales bacterium]
MARRQSLIPLLILLAAAVLRLVLLDLKPPHFDEGINGWWCDEMAKHGYYAYDPTNYHGPLHFYVLFAFLRLFGRNLWALRLPVALMGIATVGLVLSFHRHLGRSVAYLTAAAVALSPGFVFYQRYSIHETWLTFFLILFFWALYRLYQTTDRLGTAALVLSVTGMVLTKETYIIHLFAAAVAAGFVLIFSKQRGELFQRLWQGLEPRAFRWAAAAGVFLVVFFYSGNFLHLEGLRGLFETFTPWTKTGIDAAGHAKTDYDLFAVVPKALATVGPLAKLRPFKVNWYWVKLFTVYEWFALAGLLLSTRYFFTGRHGLRFLAVYAWLTLLAYSLIPYKTPWCVISIAWPFFFLSSAGLVSLHRVLTVWPVAAVAAALLGHDAWQMGRLNFSQYDNPRQMYAYVQTYRDYRWFVDPILQEIRLDPGAKGRLKGNVLLSSYFPIPWVLGELSHVGYYSDDEAWPKQLDADFIVAEDELAGDVEAELTQTYFENTFRLRDGMGPCRVFFRYDTFKNVFPNRQPDFRPEPHE